jgi:hypothetical protein
MKGSQVFASHNASIVRGRAWSAEHDRLTDDLQVDQRGDRWLRLVRIVNREETGRGTLRDCEFQVDRT